MDMCKKIRIITNKKCEACESFISKGAKRFCSFSCCIIYRNKFENPAQTENGRKKISEFAKKRGTAFLHTPEKHAKLSKSISGSGHWNWQGDLTHPNCIDCGIKITFRKKRCKPCHGKSIRGKNAPNWKGGKTKENKLLRKRKETINWRKSVFERDNWTCRECGDRNGKGKKVILNAHHIQSWAKYPELRWYINNGLTLCLKCHKKTDSYMGRNREIIN